MKTYKETETLVNQPQQEMKAALLVGLPIILGYFPVAIAYGVLAKQAGLSLFELTSMSVLVYAGASQFMAVNMLMVSAGWIEIVIATFVLNFRHFIMNLSLMNKWQHLSTSSKLPLSLGVTDETFAVASMEADNKAVKRGFVFYATLLLAAYLSWVIGSLLGGVLGQVIPDQLSQSMGIALYAMFIGLLIPSVKKELKYGLIALVAMLLNVIFSQWLSEGWSIVSATVIGASAGIFLLKDDDL